MTGARPRGRPPAMSPAQAHQAYRARAAHVTISEIARMFRVGRATVYRHLAAYHPATSA